MNLEQQVKQREELGLKRPNRKVPKQIDPRPIVREYTRAIWRTIDVTREALKPLAAALPGLIDSSRRARGIRDAGEYRTVKELIKEAEQQIAQTLTPDQLENLASVFGERTQTWQRRQLNKQVRAILGVDPFYADANLARMLEDFAHNGASLIQNISGNILNQVELATTRAIQQATPHRELAKEIEKIFGGSRERAKLVARNEIGSLYGKLNKERQEELGADAFIWRTSNDNRVRSLHEAHANVKYFWSKPPKDGIPGEPIRCRCTAEPVFDF